MHYFFQCFYKRNGLQLDLREKYKRSFLFLIRNFCPGFVITFFFKYAISLLTLSAANSCAQTFFKWKKQSSLQPFLIG